MIWSGRTADSEVFHLKSEMIHLAPALAMLCAAQSQVPGFLPDDAWFRARVQEALDDPRPRIPAEEVEAEFAARRAVLRARIARGEK